METISVGVNRLAEYLTAAKNLTLPSLVGKVTPCTSFLPRSPLHPDVFYATTKPLKRSILLSPSPFLPLLAPLSPSLCCHCQHAVPRHATWGNPFGLLTEPTEVLKNRASSPPLEQTAPRRDSWSFWSLEHGIRSSPSSLCSGPGGKVACRRIIVGHQ